MGIKATGYLLKTRRKIVKSRYRICYFKKVTPKPYRKSFGVVFRKSLQKDFYAIP